MPETRRTVFLDTQVFVAAKFDYNSKEFQILSSLVAGGRVRLLQTEITVREIRNKLLSEVDLIWQKYGTFVRASPLLRLSDTEGAKRLLTPPEKNALTSECLERLDYFLDRLNVAVLDCSTLPAGPILDDYFALRPPFENKPNKKAEFPDAFALQALRQWAVEKKAEVIVVSGDKGMGSACSEGLRHVESLVELLSEIMSDGDERTEFVRRELVARLKSLSNDVTSAFQRLQFVLDVERGKIEEVEVLHVGYGDDVIVVENDRTSATVFVVATFTFRAQLAVIEGGLMDGPYGDEIYEDTFRENVEQQEERLLEVLVDFNGLDSMSFRVGRVVDARPADAVVVKSSRRLGHPWK